MLITPTLPLKSKHPLTIDYRLVTTGNESKTGVQTEQMYNHYTLHKRISTTTKINI